MLRDHALPRARVAVLERETLRVGAVAEDDRIASVGRPGGTRPRAAPGRRPSRSGRPSRCASRRGFRSLATPIRSSSCEIAAVVCRSSPAGIIARQFDATVQRECQLTRVPSQRTMEHAIENRNRRHGPDGCGHRRAAAGRRPRSHRWNRTAAKTAGARAARARKSRPRPRELASSVEIVITHLTDAAAIDATYHGGNGGCSPATSRASSSSR